MNTQSAKMELVGGPLDGARRIIVVVTNVIYMQGPGRRRARILKYVLCNGKYYFKGYDVPNVLHERSE